VLAVVSGALLAAATPAAIARRTGAPAGAAPLLGASPPAASRTVTTRRRTTRPATRTTAAARVSRSVGTPVPAATVATVPPAVAATLGPSGRATLDRWVWWRGINLAGADFAMSNGTEPAGTHRDPRTHERDREYQFPGPEDLAYLASKRMNLVRLPIGWERVQPDLFGPLDPTYLAGIRAVVDEAKRLKLTVIIDVHNYARYWVRGGDRPVVIGAPGVPVEALGDLWAKLAAQWPSDPAVVLGLMNEPHTMSSAVWVDAVNGAIAAIRASGAANLVLVPGNNWSGAFTWLDAWPPNPSNADAMTQIRDPLDWWMYEMHQYPDRDGSGNTEDCMSRTIGSQRMGAATAWLRRQRRPAILGEFRIGRNDTCYAALEDWLRYLEANGDVWKGWAYWAGGRAWNASLNVTNPIRNPDGSLTDRPVVDVLERWVP
jgi:endoglucanase